MTCTKITVPGFVGPVVVCDRKKRPRCHACSTPADFICDGCDAKLCDGCRVSAKPIEKERDFCPVCFGDVWKLFLRTHPEVKGLQRIARRDAFRAWAIENPGAFGPIPLTRKGAQ